MRTLLFHIRPSLHLLRLLSVLRKLTVRRTSVCDRESQVVFTFHHPDTAICVDTTLGYVVSLRAVVHDTDPLFVIVLLPPRARPKVQILLAY